MDHLSSCYFCGAALDEPLGAYSLDSAGGGRPVTLCASCRHKLDTLLEANDLGATLPTDTASEANEQSPEAAPTPDDGATAPASTTTTPAEDDAVESAISSAEAPPTADTKSEASTPADAKSTPHDESQESEPELDAEPDEEPVEGSSDAVVEGEKADEDSGTDAVSESAITPGRVAELGPEPVMTDPSDLPDDEEVNVVPGLAAETDDTTESTLSEEMEPDVPDAFSEFTGDPETDDGAELDETEEAEEPVDLSPDDNLETDVSEAEGAVEDDDQNIAFGETDDDFGSIEDVDTTPVDETSDDAGDPVEDIEAGDTPEVTDLSENEDNHDETPDSGVDPSILQADEIATGNADIEEVLADDIDTPTDSDDSIFDDGLDAVEGNSSAEPELSETSDEDESITDDKPFDIGPDDVSDADPDDGGFDFDNGPEPDADEDLQSEMEPDIPEEFSSTAEEIAGTLGNEPGDSSAEAHDEEVAFEETDADAPEGQTADTSLEEIASEDSESTPDLSDSSPAEPESAGEDSAGGQSEPTVDMSSSSANDGSDTRRSISALEYNKVMRLLQNREFPVDRMELLAVAASTYDLSQEDCEAVLDIAVERGLLAQDGNKLVKPD